MVLGGGSLSGSLEVWLYPGQIGVEEAAAGVAHGAMVLVDSGLHSTTDKLSRHISTRVDATEIFLQT